MSLFVKSLAAFAFYILLSLGLSSTANAGPGDLLVSPVRVVFEDRKRVAEVTLVNKGQQNATYRISFENRRMLRNGAFEKIDMPGNGDLFAEKLVRYAPRRVVLAPNAPQTLRLMLRKPSTLEEGEYRSHLHFAAVPEESGSSSIEAGQDDTDGISIKLTPVYGLTIPIIVRHGALEATAAITRLKQSKDNQGRTVLEFVFERTGTKSLYGDFTVTAIGVKDPLALKKGIALYTPNKERVITITLGPEASAIAAGKQIELKFQDKTESGDHIQSTASLRLK